MQKLKIMIPGRIGELEAVLQIPDNFSGNKIAVVCHPHPLQGGNMSNKVVTTVAKTFNSLDVAALRFNYRGVGKSDGTYGEFIGECEDGIAATRWLLDKYPRATLYLAGFSFGSYIAAFIADQFDPEYLISIAPPVERMPFVDLLNVHCSWLVIQGEADEVVTPQAVYDWYDDLQADKTLVRVPETGHYFHKKIIVLRDILLENLKGR